MSTRSEADCEDDTPRPLRIVKRDPRAASGEMLHVSKQRHTNLRGAHDLALGDVAGRTLSHANTPREDLQQASDPDRQLYEPARCSARATTTGLTSHRHASLTPSVAAPFVSIPRPRAVTAGTSRPGDPHINIPRLRPPQPTTSSLRARLFSRMTNGVAGRPHSSQAAVEREATAQQVNENLDFDVDHKRLQRIMSRSGTSSSVETAAAFNYDLDVALAAFPTPPKSTVTSPTTASSFETSRTTSPSLRTLIEPKNVAIPSAQLNVISDVDRLGVDGGRSILVAVEIIGGTTLIRDVPGEMQSTFTGLDVAIVIDNSLFASPATLLANCEAARFIASLLDTTTDRLAILCTKPIKSNPKDPNVVSQLSRKSIRTIKSTVDAIIDSTNKLEPAALGMAIDRALNLLTDPVCEQSDDEPGGEACGHVFILTANAVGVPSLLLDPAKIQVHVIQAGPVPWKGSSATTCSGFKLAPLYSSSLQYMSSQKDKDRDSLFNQLRSLIHLARTGRSCGRVIDLVLEIEAGQECRIEAVMGRQEIGSLRPGEVITALVRVKVGTIHAKGYTLSRSTSLTNSNSPTKSNDVFDELDVMLGASPIPVLIAKLTYKHTLLSACTRCSTIAALKLKRPLLHTDEDMVVTNTANQAAANMKVPVQKRLVGYLAIHHSPRRALSVLQANFGKDGQGSSCPQYIKLVTEELRYQARIIERFDLPSPIKGNLPVLPDALPQEHVRQYLFTTSNSEPQDWLAGVSDKEGSTTPAPPTQSSNYNQTLVQGQHTAGVSRSVSKRSGISMPSARQARTPLLPRRDRAPTSESQRDSVVSQSVATKVPVDEARWMWGRMRKASRGNRGLTELRLSNSKRSETDARKGNRIGDMGTRNKKSAGTDAVVSLQSAVVTGRENVAPWL